MSVVTFHFIFGDDYKFVADVIRDAHHHRVDGPPQHDVSESPKEKLKQSPPKAEYS